MNLPSWLDWEAPRLLWGLVLVPVVGLLMLWASRRRTRGAERYADPRLMGASLRPARRPGRVVAAVLALVALSGGVVALARPYEVATEEKSRATVMLAMDVSDSMKKTDISPTRLAAAQDAARRFIESAPKDVRIGLVAMAGSADVVAAPTTDRTELLTALRERFATTRYGTAIGDAISTSLSALRASGALDSAPARPQDSAGRVLVITDGAQVGGSVQPDEGAQMAAAARVPVYTIMIGNDPGVRGQPAPPDTLSQIASTTGGVFAQTATADDLRAVFADMGRVLAPEPETRQYAWIPAAAALGLLILAVAALVGIPEAARRPRPA